MGFGLCDFSNEAQHASTASLLLVSLANWPCSYITSSIIRWCSVPSTDLACKVLDRCITYPEEDTDDCGIEFDYDVVEEYLCQEETDSP